MTALIQTLILASPFQNAQRLSHRSEVFVFLSIFALRPTVCSSQSFLRYISRTPSLGSVAAARRAGNKAPTTAACRTTFEARLDPAGYARDADETRDTKGLGTPQLATRAVDRQAAKVYREAAAQSRVEAILLAPGSCCSPASCCSQRKGVGLLNILFDERYLCLPGESGGLPSPCAQSFCG
jgi:hypothetical protein